MIADSASPFIFLLLVLLAIVGTALAMFFGLGGIAGATLPAEHDVTESRRARFGRRVLGASDLILAVAAVGFLLFWSVIATLAAILGTTRSPLVIWVPLVGAALAGGTFVSAAIAQFMRKRHRWLVQLAAVVVPVAAFVVHLLVERLAP